jgi:tetratricopeptide (TPR) repeat protein
LPDRTIHDRRLTLWLCLALAAALFAVYAPVASHEFLDWDDGAYVKNNPHVYHGLTAAGLGWALSTHHMGNWHPLTWLSHMLDCELFGLDAGAHHLVNVALHAAVAIVLLLALRRMTGRVWPAACVAALFALHPLRVESVAWASERKDVLAALFWMLALLAYAAYAERGGLGRYLGVLAAMAAGLMAKAMLVTLPFALLLLDVWPLDRFRERGARRRLLLEKLPLVALAGVASGAAMLAQRSTGALGSLEVLGLGARLQNALLSYALYLRDTFWPVGLAYFYPHPALAGEGAPSAAALLVAALVLSLVTLLTVGSVRRRPWLAVGWLWYLGTLVPVIGLVQLGMQGRADRYTYIPSVGLALAVVWGVAELASGSGRHRRALAVAGVLAVVGCLAGTAYQLKFWKDNRALSERALAVTADNHRAHDLLGVALERQGDSRRAVEQFRIALGIQPQCSGCLLNLATSLGKLGYGEEAQAMFTEALRVKPKSSGPRSHNGLGALLLRQGELAAAQSHLERAVELEPTFAEAHNNLGVVYEAQGRLDEARARFEWALAIAPDYALARQNLGGVLKSQGHLEAAAEQLRRAIELEPDMLEAHFKLAVVDGTLGALAEAVTGFERVLRLDPEFAEAHYNLGIVLSATGDTERSVAHLRRALELDPDHAGARRALAGDRATTQ